MTDKVVEMIIWIVKRIAGVEGNMLLTPADIKIDSVWVGWMQQVWYYFAILGVGLSLIFFLTEINRKLMFEGNDFTLKSMAAPFLKFAASYAVLYKGGTIIAILVNLGNAFIDKLSNTSFFNPGSTALTALPTLFQDAGDGLSFFAALIIALPVLVMFIVTLICSFVWKYKALGFKIEVLFRIGISPVALADIYSGQNSQGVRWCKALFGTMLYGASFIMVTKIGNGIALTEVVNTTTNILNNGSGVLKWIEALAFLIVVPIAELGVIGAIRTAIKEALA